MKPIFQYFVYFILLIVFTSCRNTKAPTSFTYGKLQNKYSYGSTKKIVFENMFFVGLKADLVDHDYQKAINEYQHCLALDSKNTSVLYNLGSLYFKLKRYSEAKKVVEKAVQIDGENKWHLLLLSQIYKTIKEYDKAAKVLKEIIRMNPKEIGPYYELSNIYIWMDQPAKALKVYDQIEKITGFNPDISIQRKKIYLATNKEDKAIEEINNLIKHFPEDVKYLKMLAELYLSLDKTGNELLEVYKRILEQDKNDGQTQLALANYYFKNNNEAEAIKMIKAAISNPSLKIEPKLAFIMFNYLHGGLKLEDSDYLLEISDILLNIHSENARSYTFKADIYFDLNQMDSAIKYYDQALGYEKGVVYIWNRLISLVFDRRNYIEVIDYVSQAIEYFPNHPEFYLYQGVANLQLKKYQLAYEILEEGESYVLDDPSLLFRFYSSLGEACNGIQKFKLSDKYFDKALEIDPSNTLVLNNYAYYLSLRNILLDKAESMSKKSLEIMPDRPAYLDTYGWIKFLQGDYADAELNIKRALEINPNDPDLLEHYGDVLFKQQRVQEAKEFWKKAMKNGSVSESLKRKIQEGKLDE